MAIIKIRDADGNVREILAIKGDKGDKGDFEDLTPEQKASLKGDKGDRGNSGVYLGSGDMPDDCNVQIDPNGKVTMLEQIINRVVEKIEDSLKNKPSVSNALKSNKTGEVVSIDDVSPIVHRLDVKVSGVEDVSAVKVKRCGKNFFDVSKVITSKPTPERFVENNGDGSITVSVGSQTSTCAEKTPYTLRDYAPDLKVGEKYTLSADSTGTDNWIWLTGYNSSWYFSGNKTRTLTITEEMLNSRVNWYASGTNTVATISNIQIELGKTATEYEPYVEPIECAVNADGSVDGIDSTYPVTNLLTDTTGAVIECNYSRDVNKAYEELTQAIISLGGNI